MPVSQDHGEEHPSKKQRLDVHIFNSNAGDSSDDDEFPEYLQASSVNDKQNNDGFCLDTINRNLLDFDFEKVCLISLSSVNVYCCLVCGKFFQGRSKSSHAYLHSVNANHRVFLNLDTERAYILPDNYELTLPKALKNLQDIKWLLNPKYTKDDIKQLSMQVKTAYDLNHGPYLVGFIGLNNISANDYANTILQAVSHIEPVRDFYLSLSLPDNDEINDKITRKSELNNKFGLLVRKIWSSYLFKSHISPHEFLQLVSRLSKKKFNISDQKSPKVFMIWLLNQLHLQLSKSIKNPKTILSESLQGQIQVTTVPLSSSTNESTNKIDFTVNDNDKKILALKFWILSLQLPGNSLFLGTSNQGDQTSQIPQISIHELLKKYDGKTTSQVSSSELRTYKLLKPLPPYIILHIDRGLDNDDETSRGNPMVVKFPSIMDMSPYVLDSGDEQMNYKLVSNVKHELVPGVQLDHKDDKHQWSIDLCKKWDTNDWVTIRDLEIENCESELMFLRESFLQVWERC